MLECEQDAWSGGIVRVAGVDEAGRGPWAGPVFAAAVMFEPDAARRLAAGLLAGLTDSKRLSERKRDEYFLRLSGAPGVCWGAASVSAAGIDRSNVLRAALQAMSRAVRSLPEPPERVLVDGPILPELPCPARAIVRGDALSFSIAAASVVAKVLRDRAMRGLDRRFPGYGFARHKGYGTAEHRAALLRLGPCPEHRRTFAPVARILEAARSAARKPLGALDPSGGL